MEYLAHNIFVIFRSIIFVVLAGYFGLTLFLYFSQSNMIYYPVPEIEATPASIGLAFEDVMFEAKDGVKLNGWFIPANESKGIILMCHGNGGNISYRMDTIRIFNQLGLSMFIFDYRGYGRSGGKPKEKGTYADAEAALHWITVNRDVLPQEIIIFGRSLGGAIAAWLAKEYTPKTLILESAFTSVPDMGVQMYPWLPVRLLSRFKYSTIDYLKAVKCPVLIVHSPEDDITPYSHGKHLFEAAHEPKDFLDITGTHNDGFLKSGKQYIDGLKSFISGYE